jgi:hypothetical protein
MTHVHLMRAAVCAATLGAGCVLAQIAAPVVTDIAPAPAEDRDSTGAIVLQSSLVRAQRDNAFERASSRNGLGSVGRRAVRAAMDRQPQGELAEVREPRPIELHQPSADREIQN